MSVDTYLFRPAPGRSSDSSAYSVIASPQLQTSAPGTHMSLADADVDNVLQHCEDSAIRDTPLNNGANVIDSEEYRMVKEEARAALFLLFGTCYEFARLNSGQKFQVISAKEALLTEAELLAKHLVFHALRSAWLDEFDGVAKRSDLDDFTGKVFVNRQYQAAVKAMNALFNTCKKPTIKSSTLLAFNPYAFKRLASGKNKEKYWEAADNMPMKWHLSQKRTRKSGKAKTPTLSINLANAAIRAQAEYFSRTQAWQVPLTEPKQVIAVSLVVTFPHRGPNAVSLAEARVEILASDLGKLVTFALIAEDHAELEESDGGWPKGMSEWMWNTGYADITTPVKFRQTPPSGAKDMLQNPSQTHEDLAPTPDSHLEDVRFPWSILPKFSTAWQW